MYIIHIKSFLHHITNIKYDKYIHHNIYSVTLYDFVGSQSDDKRHLFILNCTIHDA